VVTVLNLYDSLQGFNAGQYDVQPPATPSSLLSFGLAVAVHNNTLVVTSKDTTALTSRVHFYTRAGLFSEWTEAAQSAITVTDGVFTVARFSPSGTYLALTKADPVSSL
jgi:hypothetical protein